MDILILGGTGQIGAPIARHLIQQGHKVWVTGRQKPTSPELSERFIRFVPGETDWSDLPTCTIVINCLGIIVESASQTFEKIHLEMVQNILNQQELLGFNYFIQMSALGANPLHPAKFLATKGLADQLIQNTMLRYAIVRPSIVCTPHTRLVHNLYQLIRSFGKYFGLIPLVGQGEFRVQPVLIEDLVALIDQLVIHRPERLIVNAVGPEQYTIRELVQIMQITLNNRAKLIGIPIPCLYPIALITEWFYPHFLSREHLLLLQQNNISSTVEIERWLGHSVQSTESFFSNLNNWSAPRKTYF